MFRVTLIANSKQNNIKNVNVSEFKGKEVKYSKENDAVSFWIDETLGEERIRQIEEQFNCNVLIISKEIYDHCRDPAIPKVAVFDLDSTLIQMEVIDTLAACKPEISKEVSRITEESMAGRIDFGESLTRRVALLEGINAEDQWNFIKKTVKFTTGAFDLFSKVLNKKNGWTTAVISGGFLPIADWVKEELNLSFAFANNLEIDSESGNLTGRLLPNHQIIDSKAKAAHLIELMNQVEGEISLAVGDGANDLLMLGEATVGIAFNAKPIVKEKAKFRINNENIYLLSQIFE